MVGLDMCCEEKDEIRKQRKKLGKEMKRERNSCRVRAKRMREEDKTRKG